MTLTLWTPGFGTIRITFVEARTPLVSTLRPVEVQKALLVPEMSFIYNALSINARIVRIAF